MRLLFTLLAAVLFVLPAGRAEADQRFDAVVVLDLSGSMMKGKGRDHFQRVLRWLVSSGKVGDRLGIVTFGKDARVESRLQAISKFHPDLYRASFEGKARFTNLAAGLEQAYDLLKEGGRPGVSRWIILISDGKVYVPGGKQAIERSEQYLLGGLSAAMVKARVRLFAIIPKGYTADFHLLQELTTKNDGDYFRGLPQNIKALFPRAGTSPAPAPAKAAQPKKQPPPVASEAAPAPASEAAPGPAPTRDGGQGSGRSGSVFLVVALVLLLGLLLVVLVRRRRSTGEDPRQLASLAQEVQVLRSQLHSRAQDPPAQSVVDPMQEGELERAMDLVPSDEDGPQDKTSQELAFWESVAREQAFKEQMTLEMAAALQEELKPAPEPPPPSVKPPSQMVRGVTGLMEIPTLVTRLESPLALDEAIELMHSAKQRDELMEALARGARQYLDRVQIFLCKGTLLEGLMELGWREQSDADVRDLRLSADICPEVADALQGGLVYVGAVPQSEDLQEVMSRAGMADEGGLALLPVLIGPRPICLVLGYSEDAGDVTPQLFGPLAQLATAASTALKSFILRKKNPTGPVQTG